MKLLFTKVGSAKSGSWQVRGVQIADVLGAKIAVNAMMRDIQESDVVVVVKHFDEQLASRVQLAGKPVIWDALDCWPQPEGNAWNREQAMAKVSGKLGVLKPSLVIAATAEMAGDFRQLTDVPTTVIYHHARQGQELNPIRSEVQVVGYQGSPRYLQGGWLDAICKECDKRGWAFMINPPRLAALDIVFAVRGGEWRGYQTDHWKSNVKLANAQSTGTPIICLPEAGCRETASGAEVWIDEPRGIAEALKALESYQDRIRCSRTLVAASLPFNKVLERYVDVCDKFIH